MGTGFVAPTEVERGVVIKTHPDYVAQYRRLRFARENYEGSGGYAPYISDIKILDTQPDDEQAGTFDVNKADRTHLFRHPREKEKFTRRVIMAYPTNVIKKALSMILGYVTKKQPVYDDYPKTVKDWMSKVNAGGDTWEQFKESEIFPALGYYGWLPTIFFYPPTKSETEEQRKAAGGELSVEVICPENIIDWKWKPEGQYEWLKIKTEVDRTGPLDENPVLVDRYTWYTQEGWWAVEDTEKQGGSKVKLPVVEYGKYENGLPIVVWQLKGGAMTADCDATQRELYNVNSLIQEQERETCFAMLRAPDQGASTPRVKSSGSDNVWWFPPDSRHPPEWMAPPPHVLEHLMAKREVLTAEIIENMGLDFDEGGGQTGMAFQFKMSKIVRLLQGIANSFSRGETRALARVALEKKTPLKDNVRCIYPDEFDARDVEKLQDSLERILDRSKSTSAKIDADYKLTLAGLGDVDEEKRTTYLKEMEEGWKAAKEDADNMGDLMDAAGDARERLDGEQGPKLPDEGARDVQADGGSR